MSFKKYSSLENHTNAKFLEKVMDSIQEGTCENNFVAREKIHGTNFSVIITSDDIIPAKRSGPIEVTESFFGWQDLMAKYKANFVQIQDVLNYGNNPKASIQIFGEYAGGGIQKEVDYGDKDFYVFDVLIDTGVDSMYYDDIEVTHFCNTHDLKMAPLITTGTLQELLTLPVEFESLVNEYDKQFEANGSMANYMAFKQSEVKDNAAEGLVIKPIKPAFLRTGSRIAIKYKTDAFKEKKKGQLPKIPTQVLPVSLF